MTCWTIRRATPPFYLSFGMQVVDTRDGVPESIAGKLGYCQKQHALGFYAHGLALLSFGT